MSIVLTPKPAGTLYDAVTQEAAGISLTAEGARIISVHGITGAQTTVTVQVRISDDSPWMSYKVIDPAQPNALVEFAGNYNRVRVINLIAGNTVFAQG